MNTIKNLCRVGIIALVAVCATLSVQASGTLKYFYCTNSIDSTAATITAYPTNVVSTNGITFVYTNFVSAPGVTNALYTNTLYPGTLTGKAQSIFNQEHCVLNVQGWLVSTNTTGYTIGINLTTACTAGNPPGVGNNSLNLLSGINTNGFPVYYQLGQNDFETVPARWVVVPIPANYTNWFNWSTNIVMDSISSTGNLPNADYVGIYQITNNFTATCSLVNPLGPIAINTKLIPTPLIGQ